VITLASGWLIALIRGYQRYRCISWQLVNSVLTVAIAVGLSLALNQLIGNLWFRPRPYARHASAHLLVAASADPSFPSDHATAGFAIALGAATSLPATAFIVVVETIVMSVARVYVGLHYPGDILGGLLTAALAALIATGVVKLCEPLLARVRAASNALAGRMSLPVQFR
jgi:undecaprenyl-diphosphatase